MPEETCPSGAKAGASSAGPRGPQEGHSMMSTAAAAGTRRPHHRHTPDGKSKGMQLSQQACEVGTSVSESSHAPTTTAMVTTSASSGGDDAPLRPVTQHDRRHRHRHHRRHHAKSYRKGLTGAGRPFGAVPGAGDTAEEVVPTSLCMNPYVRCVRLSNTVPEIKSLKELLAVQHHIAAAEVDTPCLRPSDVGRVRSAQDLTSNRSSHGALAAAVAGNTGKAHTARTSAKGNALSASGDAKSESAPHAAGQPVAPSPTLAFTMDGVATPNTFATLQRQQRRMVAAAASQHVPPPPPPPSHPISGTLMDATTASEHAAQGPSTRADKNASGLSGRNDGSVSCEGGEGNSSPIDEGEMGVVDMQLPSTTVEVAAATEMQRWQQREGTSRSASAVTTQRSTPHPEPLVDGALRGGRGDSSREAAHSSTDSYQSADVPCPDVLQHQVNERIISPRSMEVPLGCRQSLSLTPGTAAAVAATGGFPDAPVTQPTPRNRFLERVDKKTATSPPPQGSEAAAGAVKPSSVPLRISEVIPAAKIEESPYHYIMRNYVGGTFLYYGCGESKQYFLDMCYKVIAQVTPILERETVNPAKGLFPTLPAPAYILGDVHGNFEDLSFFLKQMIPFHDFNLTPANLLCLGDYVDRGPFSLECVMLLFSLKVMNAEKLVLLRGNHEDRVVCGDLQTYGHGCFAAQCQTVFGYVKGMKLFRAVTALFRYLPLACELVVPYAPNQSGTAAAAAAGATSMVIPSAAAAAPVAPSSTDRGLLSQAMGATASALPSASEGMKDAWVGDRVHENLYVRQVCVPLQPTTPPQGPRGPLAAEAAAEPTTAHDPSPPRAAIMRGRSTSLYSSSSSSAISRSSSSASQGSSCSSSSSSASLSHSSGTFSASDDGSARYPSGTYAAPLAPVYPGGGHPLHPFTHEERVLCTHGGIPRFFGPPLQEDSLAFLRSLHFPRLLTVFPSNHAAVADPECAPDFYNRHLLETLKHRHLPRPTCGCFCNACVEAEYREQYTVRSLHRREGHRRQRPPPHCDGEEGVTCTSEPGGCGRHATCHHRNAPVSADTHDAPAGDQEAPRDEASSGSSRRGARATQPVPPSSPSQRPSLDAIIRRGWYVAFDLMWSDPTPTEPTPLTAHDDPNTTAPTPARRAAEGHACLTNEWGFGINARGNNVISYAAKAVETFLGAYRYAMLIRAHQEKAHGLRWSKNKRVLTVFSSSNYLSHGNGAGCVILTSHGEVQMIEKLSNTHP